MRLLVACEEVEHSKDKYGVAEIKSGGDQWVYNLFCCFAGQELPNVWEVAKLVPDRLGNMWYVVIESHICIKIYTKVYAAFFWLKSPRHPFWKMVW